MTWLEEGQGQRRIVMGLLFIAAGLLFGLDRLGGFGLGDFQDWWPVLVILFGVSRMLMPSDHDSIGSGLSWALTGVWLLSVEQGWYGLTFRNSWPLVFVSVGAGMVAKALTPRAPRRDAAGGPGTGGVTS